MDAQVTTIRKKRMGRHARQVALVKISGCHWSYPTSVFIHSTTMQMLAVEVPGQAVNRRRDFEWNCPLSILLVVTGVGPSVAPRNDRRCHPPS
jgi:hypothetical protein